MAFSITRTPKYFRYLAALTKYFYKSRVIKKGFERSVYLFRKSNGEAKRLEYRLGPDSLVFDVGGYRGDFASAIYNRYNSQIWIFEPVLGFHKLMEARFKDNEKMCKINNLLDTNADILNFGESYITQETTKNNFMKLKTSLGKLQILVLINDLKKSKNCDDVLDSFIKVFNDKIESVNTILADNLIQSGGNSNYIIKYIKYKKKYLDMK